MGDQADGLRRLFGAPPAMLAVAAREADVIDAYARIKRAVHEHGCKCFRITITHARTPEEAHTVFDNMRRVAHEYLGVRLEYLGMAVAGGDEAEAAVRARRPGAVAHDSVL
jgi:MinD-like ATPase involved in chromosome partitioning or flagellar assembly